MVAFGDMGFRITGAVDTGGVSNPLRTAVEAAPGAWLDNYGRYPWMVIAPALGFLGAAAALVGLIRRSAPLALGGSSASALGIISTVGLSMFPFILPSSLDPRASLTVWDASSSHMTLFNMLVACAIVIPLIVVYTGWVYRVLSGKVTEKDMADLSRHAY